MKSLKKKNFYKISALALALWLLAMNRGNAQQSSPEIIITWHANTYVPAWFEGKALPTANSGITASMELIDGGKLVDLSGQKIYWYVDDQFINGGAGLQNVAFSAPGISGNTMDVRVEVPSYKSALKTIEIPVVDPEAVITSPFPSNQFSATPITLNGWPFFFNAKNASNIMTSWSVNGVVSGNAEDPGTLTVNLNPDAPSGSNLAIGITMGTPGSRLGFGAKTINLTLIR